MGRRESIGQRIAIGYLTTDTLIGDDGRYHPCGEQGLHADAELWVELEADLNGDADADSARAAIGACGPAVEIVDLAISRDEPGSIVAGNVFHRAVAFGAARRPLDASGQVTVYVNGEPRGNGPWPEDISKRIAAAAPLLEAVGQRCERAKRSSPARSSKSRSLPAIMSRQTSVHTVRLPSS
jgi:hypothetical protein